MKVAVRLLLYLPDNALNYEAFLENFEPTRMIDSRENVLPVFAWNSAALV